jgi:hypothetical protein
MHKLFLREFVATVGRDGPTGRGFADGLIRTMTVDASRGTGQKQESRHGRLVVGKVAIQESQEVGQSARFLLQGSLLRADHSGPGDPQHGPGVKPASGSVDKRCRRGIQLLRKDRG